jgi:hypothetical protein
MQRAAVCDASVVLPRVPDNGEQSASALRGSRIHAWIAAKLRGWPLPDIGKTKVDHIDLTQLRAYLGDGELRCEMAFAFDGERVTRLGENLGREYNAAGICGAADIVVVRDHMMVVDIKTGSYPVPSPRENWQLATLASFAVDVCADVTGVIALLARDGSWTFDAHTWSRGELAEHRRRLSHRMTSQWPAALELESSGWGATKTVNAECRFCKSVCENARQPAPQVWSARGAEATV